LTPVGKPAIKNNQTYTGNPIVLDGKVQENGVGAMPGKDIVYTIPVGAKRFVSTVIMESSEPADIHSKCIYTLIGDVLEMGEPPVELTRSPALGAGEKWHFNVELGSRYRQIKLVSRPVGSESKVMSVNWINPGFLK
jgi:hypothetical protein